MPPAPPQPRAAEPTGTATAAPPQPGAMPAPAGDAAPRAGPPPLRIGVEGGRPTVAAAWLAARFGMSEAALRAEMRAGRIASLVERGEGEDAGRLRLTLRHGESRCTLLVEPDGAAREVAPPPAEPALFRMIAATAARPER